MDQSVSDKMDELFFPGLEIISTSEFGICFLIFDSKSDFHN